MPDLAESLHNWIDARAARMHEELDELLARHPLPSPAFRAARICVDPGHGGDAPGAVVDGVREADVVLEYGHELCRVLEGRGHHTLLTRTHDSPVSLSGRALASNEFRADAFVSIHINYASNPAAEGAWIIHSERSRLGKNLAEDIFHELVLIPGIGDTDPEDEVYPDASGWVGGRRLTVLRRTWAPAVLLELGFLSNPDDRSQLLSTDTQHKVAVAVADGLEAWLRKQTP